MSRVGKMPVPLPPGVEVKVEGNRVRVKGPKGVLEQEFHPDMQVQVVDGTIVVRRPTDARVHRALHGLTRSLLSNMVQGVTQGFRVELEIQGVGYRAQKQGRNLVLQVGFSHPVEVTPPEGIEFEVPSANRVVVTGIDKALVGQVAAQIRAIKPPDPYKGKGIRYVDEHVKLRPGKAGRAVK